MAKYDRDFDYVELKEPSNARLTAGATDRFMVEREVRMTSAKRAYMRIMAQFHRPADTSHRRWQTLRAENERRHDQAREMGHWPKNRTS